MLSKRGLPIFTVLVMLSISIGSMTPAFAATTAPSGGVKLASPQNLTQLVFATRDITASGNCTISAVLKDHAGTIVSTKKSACPAGTMIQGKAMTLKEALAAHESYTILPTNASSDSLFPAKTTVALSTVKPLISCGGSGYWVANWSWGADVGRSEVDADRYSSCNLHISTSYVYESQNNKTIYWDHDQYAGWVGHWGCQQLTNNGYWAYNSPNTTQIAGYWYEQKFADGSWCTGWDNWLQVNVGILS